MKVRRGNATHACLRSRRVAASVHDRTYARVLARPFATDDLTRSLVPGWQDVANVGHPRNRGALSQASETV